MQTASETPRIRLNLLRTPVTERERTSELSLIALLPDEEEPPSPPDGGAAGSRPPPPDDDFFTGLAESFPSLADVPGVRPFAAERLNEWAQKEAEPGSHGHHAAHFVLAVYATARNAHTAWVLRFRIFNSLASWDEVHRTAFAVWVATGARLRPSPPKQ